MHDNQVYVIISHFCALYHQKFADPQNILFEMLFISVILKSPKRIIFQAFDALYIQNTPLPPGVPLLPTPSQLD